FVAWTRKRRSDVRRGRLGPTVESAASGAVEVPSTVTAELARVGGPLGSVALAALLVVPGRFYRLAALAGWGLCALLLAVYPVPSGHHKVAAAGGVLVLLVAVGLAALFLRWPWLLALGALACAPARIPVTVGHESASLLIPLYVVVVGAAFALAWQLLHRDE